MFEIQKKNFLLNIETKQKILSEHKLYSALTSVEALRTFSEWHVFAVWDFMSLLKSLQGKLTCVELPWRPMVDVSSETTRLINEIVVGEESDLNYDGRPMSHFNMYLLAMDELKANSCKVREFIETLEFSDLPKPIRDFVSFNLDVAMNGKSHEVASVFFYGREKLIPDMFRGILAVTKENPEQYKQFNYYFERHIEVDDGDHGPKALACLQNLIKSDQSEKEALSAASKALDLRIALWDGCLESLTGKLQN